MGKRAFFVRRVFCLLCLAAAAGVLGYRAVLRFAPDKLREEVRSEIATADQIGRASCRERV